MKKSIAVSILLGSSVTMFAHAGEQSFQYKDWQMVCDNTRTCRAAGYSADAFSSLTFTVDLATSTGGTYRVYLAYQTENGWQAVESQATSGTITVTADLSGNKLTSENVYVFVESNQGRGNDSTFTASMTGELASVPEPATASLGLLGLAALMMRRRRS